MLAVRSSGWPQSGMESTWKSSEWRWHALRRSAPSVFAADDAERGIGCLEFVISESIGRAGRISRRSAQARRAYAQGRLTRAAQASSIGLLMRIPLAERKSAHHDHQQCSLTILTVITTTTTCLPRASSSITAAAAASQRLPSPPRPLPLQSFQPVASSLPFRSLSTPGPTMPSLAIDIGALHRCHASKPPVQAQTARSRPCFTSHAQASGHRRPRKVRTLLPTHLQARSVRTLLPTHLPRKTK
eukprot:3780573-Pleurochrysis_carterae.AAC.1